MSIQPLNGSFTSHAGPAAATMTQPNTTVHLVDFVGGLFPANGTRSMMQLALVVAAAIAGVFIFIKIYQSCTLKPGVQQSQEPKKSAEASQSEDEKKLREKVQDLENLGSTITAILNCKTTADLFKIKIQSNVIAENIARHACSYLELKDIAKALKEKGDLKQLDIQGHYTRKILTELQNLHSKLELSEKEKQTKK